MTRREPKELDLVGELVAAREEQRQVLAQGDTVTAGLLAAWIDVLLDEWNRRRRGDSGAPSGRLFRKEGQTPTSGAP